ncbi:hypothetical protein GOODEAATRI_020975 [Goodea atripinnis]|uniref:Uncharacterized protein n=1 Tax=Goodea atripinnis TaxID=208336 RepID=A0ABV0Q0F0_9TELE
MGADTSPQAFVRVYEAEKDQWQATTSMPTPRYGATPFVIGNRIYMMGMIIQQHSLSMNIDAELGKWVVVLRLKETLNLCTVTPSRDELLLKEALYIRKRANVC